ncbi:MAG: bifunctional methylenetetrahydrofolate dehydrogenase/methenyltetrahydrofolate cyclohydrolase FolD [Dehalococcoidia bacterium]|nr:bifunctional methylenetetrahydrofolate dehydrogenase/methenyltetrahydrofolate cyclohydrolase FolD [Dehalococcoidia bacterium]
MPAKILDGVKVAQEIRTEVAQDVRELQQTTGVTPGLGVVLVGDNPASATYVRTKSKACQEVGAVSETFTLPKTATEQEVLALVARLNHDPRFHGILVQLPLPSQISERKVTVVIDPTKDVDGLHPLNMGLLLEGSPRFIPCTPAGIQQLLLRHGYDLAGKHVVVCGRSNIVGKPVSVLLLQKQRGANATVTVCHTATRDLASITRQADILIVAAGRPNAITGDMVKRGVVVVDVGVNRVSDPAAPRGYRIVGDVDFAGVEPLAEAISPVPGGVGPMTVAMLLANTLKAAKRAAGVATANSKD